MFNSTVSSSKRETPQVVVKEGSPVLLRKRRHSSGDGGCILLASRYNGKLSATVVGHVADSTTNNSHIGHQWSGIENDLCEFEIYYGKVELSQS